MSMPVVEGSEDPIQAGRHDDILRAVGFAAEQFLRSTTWEECIDAVLGRLGEAAQVSRVYLFRNHDRDDGELLMSQTHEWVAPGISSTLGDPTNRDWPYREGYARYVELLGRGDVIQGLAKDFPSPEREDLADEDILAVAIVPIFVSDEWWGMLGFDECVSERAWLPGEVEALRIAASTLGAAIRRRELETRYRTLVEQIPAITYIAGYGETGDWIYISPQVETILGFTPAEWRAHPEPFSSHLHPEDRDRVLAEESRSDETGEPLRSEYRLFAKNRRVVWIRDQAVLVRNELGRPMFWQGVMYDVTDRKRTEQQLREAEVSYRTLVERIPAIVYRAPALRDAPYTYISPQVETMLGYKPQEWLADRTLWQSLLHKEDRERVLREDDRTEETGDPFEIEYRLIARDGREVWVRDESVLIEDGQGTMFWHGVMLDITERKRAEEQAVFLAYHDKLTGLPNRAMFEELLELALARGRRHGLSVAVLCMDLDNFKLVNDSLGHESGDQLLHQLSARLREANRQTDLVARQGGDEFLLLLADLEAGPEAGPDAPGGPRFVAQSVAGRVHEALQAPFTLSGTELFVSASIGISVFPFDARDAKAVLRNADAAMYRSKRSGPGGTVIFSVDAGDPLRQLSFTTRLRKAVEHGDWVLHYQPIIDLVGKQMLGVEALLRWNDPGHGLILPGEFIQLAEEMGLLEAIGDWALEDMGRQARAWKEQGLELELGFNLSPRQLWQPGLTDKVRRSLRSAGVDSSMVVVEITESTAMADPYRTERILDDLHQEGFRIAIDDFGTGYSSLSRLKDLSVDILKIDRSFINDLPDDRDAGSMVKAMIQLAKSLGMTPLAEGIETSAQWKFLVDHGCAVGQGFFFGRPVPPDEILARSGASPEASAG